MPFGRNTKGGGGTETIIRTVEVRDSDNAANPKVQIRKRARGGEQAPQAPGQYAIFSFQIQVGFADDTQANILRDTTTSISLHRAGETQHVRLPITNARVFATSAGEGIPEFYALAMDVDVNLIPTWAVGEGDTDFYFWGEDNTNATDALTLAERNAVGVFSDKKFVHRANRSADRVNDPRDNGDNRANRWLSELNWIVLPFDEDYDRIKALYGRGQLASITFAAHEETERGRDNLSSADRFATYGIDRINFPTDAQRLVQGNRVDIEFTEAVDTFWRARAGTEFFTSQFNTIDLELGANLGRHFSGLVSTTTASATDRVINVGGRRGLQYSANPEEQAAAIASNMVIGDDVEIAGFTLDGEHIPFAYLRITLEQVIEYNVAPGTMSLTWSSDVLPAEFADAKRITIDLHPGSAALAGTELYELMKRDSATNFVKRVITTGDLVPGAGTIKRTNTSITWGAFANERASFTGLGIERGDRIVIRAFNARGVWLGSRATKQWDSWTHFNTGAPTIQISQSNSEPLAAIWLRQAAYLHVKIIPGFRARLDSKLSARLSGLHIFRPITNSLPSSTNQGMHFAANTRTIYAYITNEKWLQLQAHKLSAHDGIQVLTEGENGLLLGTEIRTLLSPPTFTNNVVVFRFLDDEDLLPSSLTNAYQGSIIIVPVEVAKKPWVQLLTRGGTGTAYTGSHERIIPPDPDLYTEFQFRVLQTNSLTGTSWSRAFKWPSAAELGTLGMIIQDDADRDQLRIYPNVGSDRQLGFSTLTSPTLIFSIWAR